MSQNQSQPETEYGILTQQEFLDLFRARQEPGQHLIALGPTGRGKTTLIGKMLQTPPTDGVLITTIGKPDPNLQQLGEVATEWPPRMPLRLLMHDNTPFIRRIENRPKQPRDFARIRAMTNNVLLWMFARPGWTIYIPDLQIVSDPKMMGLGKQVEQLLLTLRKEDSCVWMDGQAPRWIPSAANDQTSHVLIFKTKDRRTRQRLHELSNIDIELFDWLMQDMDRYDVIWVDNLRDEVYHVANTVTGGSVVSE